MVIRLAGANYFRQRLILSTLSGRPIFIYNIRLTPDVDDPEQRIGLRDYEANLLRLLDKITKGSVIQINENGTSLAYKPGVIVGGPHLVHECPLSRGIGYYLEVLIALAPFAKKAMSIILKGITNHNAKEVSVDMIRNCTLFWLKRFQISDESEATLQVIKRGSFPLGGGEVKFTCPIVRQKLTPIQIVDEGMIKRIRGIAYVVYNFC